MLLLEKHMEINKSILDQIITEQKAEEVAGLDAVEIINNLFNELTDRERDVLIRRFGLHGTGKETLESIGNIHNLTRERIRQIETSGVKKLKQLQNLEELISGLKKVIVQALEDHGGMMEREYLLDLLVKYSVGDVKSKEEDEMIHRNYLDFMISKLLYDEFELVTGSRHFHDSYKFKFQTLDHMEQLVQELLSAIESQKKILLTEEIINMMKQMDTYSKNKEKLTTANNMDIACILGDDLYDENADIVNAHKALYSVLKAAKKIEQNNFGHWGAHHWREITPKTINDKIYLVLKNHGQPLHFEEIAERINNIGFDHKQANPATVHNELILDPKFVLVGRGLYGLKEWGYSRGTVADVIENILKEADKPLNRDDIIDRVMEKRLVKKATIILALMNKDRFERVNGGYQIKGWQDKH